MAFETSSGFFPPTEFSPKPLQRLEDFIFLWRRETDVSRFNLFAREGHKCLRGF